MYRQERSTTPKLAPPLEVRIVAFVAIFSFAVITSMTSAGGGVDVVGAVVETGGTAGTGDGVGASTTLINFVRATGEYVPLPN